MTSTEVNALRACRDTIARLLVEHSIPDREALQLVDEVTQLIDTILLADQISLDEQINPEIMALVKAEAGERRRRLLQ